MNANTQTPANISLRAARRIHEVCKRYEAAWRGPARPQLDTFLADVVGPERLQLLTELLALEVDLRRGVGEEPTEAEYRRSFPSQEEGHAIAEALRRCADSTGGAAVAPKIEGYDILDVLGRGGMGVVYKARDLRLKRLVALKMVLGSEYAGQKGTGTICRDGPKGAAHKLYLSPFVHPVATTNLPPGLRIGSVRGGEPRSAGRDAIVAASA